MLITFRSTDLPRERTAARDERRDPRRDVDARRSLVIRTIGVDLDDRRLDVDGDIEGTAGTAVLGGGGGCILPAFPMPLGSLIELLRPPTLPGPRGMPLTPASPAPCARASIGAIKPTIAMTITADLPNIDRSPLKIVAARSGSS